MMIRTRDFILFLIGAGFLIIGVGIEILQNFQAEHGSGMRPVPEFIVAESVSLGADIETIPDERAGRLARWKELLLGAPVDDEPDVAVVEEMPEPEEAVATSTPNAIMRCADNRPYTASWPATGIVFSEREGVRLLHTGAAAADGTLEGILLVLPVREYAAMTASCLPYDVVGVALDGSLIRNDEYALYGVFGESTHIGYALDGFPIYGTSAQNTDACGGVATPTGYRYYLDSEREAIINCFSAIPATF